jgi:hypothetical protein
VVIDYSVGDNAYRSADDLERSVTVYSLVAFSVSVEHAQWHPRRADRPFPVEFPQLGGGLL